MRHFISILLGMTLPLSAVGAPLHTLADVAALALQQDPRTAVVAARLSQAQADRESALSGYRPDVAVTASAGRSRYDAQGSNDPGRNPTLMELRAVQPLYDFGRTAAKLSASDARIRAAHAEDLVTVMQVTDDAAVAALQVDLAHKRLDTEGHNAEVLAKQLDYTRAKFKAGDFTRTDVAQARARYADAQARRHAAEAALARARARLQQITGAESDVQLNSLPVIDTPSTLAKALAAVESHPALLAAQANVLSARDGTHAARAALRPRLDLVGSLARDDDTRFSTTTTSYWSAVVQVSAPLYAGGANRAAVRRARAGEDEAVAQLTTERRELDRRVRSAWADLGAAKDELKATRQQKAAADIALTGMNSELEAGTRTVVELLDAQQEVLNADLAVLNARYAQTINAIRLQAATGQLRLNTLK